MYRVVQGDTFGTISRKSYGVETNSDLIARANPGAREPLVVGSLMVIPVATTDPTNTPSSIPTGDPDDVTILIDGKRFKFWTEVRLTTVMDSIDTVEFVAPFDPNDPLFRESFVPFSYASVIVYIGGFVAFVGTMVNLVPAVNDNSRTVSVSCYSTPGVLQDCTIPASSYAGERAGNEYNGQTLREIATTICQDFGISVVFDDDPGAVFDKVAVSNEDLIWDFLSDLAKQRNLIMTNNARGELLFYREETAQPVANLSQGDSPLMSITPFFNPRQYYSHMTGVAVTGLGKVGSQFTGENKHTFGVIRPFTFTATDTEKADMSTAVDSKLGRMFGNAVSYGVNVPTWRTPTGSPWVRGSQLTLHAPDAMIYDDYTFTIRSVVFTASANARTASLVLVLPGSFGGKVPEVLPWD